MMKDLEFIKEGMTFEEMIAEADKSAVTRRAFIGAVGAALAAGVVLKPKEALAWNSFNTKVSGVAYSTKGLADCVHEDITQIAYAYALYKYTQITSTLEVNKGLRDGTTYKINVPNIPGGLLNPYEPHKVGHGGFYNTGYQAPSFNDTDLKDFGNYDPLPNSMYAENVAFLRMGAFWNDSACNSISDFMWNYVRCDAIKSFSKGKYENVYDVACHMLEDQATESGFGSALIKFSMGERASFIHAMQAFQPNATTKIPQGQCREMMLQWLGVAWEYARTGDPDNIEVEGLTKEQCRTIFDAFIDIYNQRYVDFDDKTTEWKNLPLEDLLSDTAGYKKKGDKEGGAIDNFEWPDNIKKDDGIGYGYGGPNPLNIRDMRCRSIPMTKRFLRLRALGMFSHTIEDSWCSSHCSRTYPTVDSDLKYQIVGFNYYFRQKGSGSGTTNRHAPYDQVCGTDQKYQPFKESNGNKNNLRQIMTFNDERPWYKFWDFLDWFPDRYAFDRGTNKLYNFAPGQYADFKYHAAEDSSVEYKVLKSWLDVDQSLPDKIENFDVSRPVSHETTSEKYGFKTYGMAEAINTMSTLYLLFMDNYTWEDVKPWLLKNTLKCAFKPDKSGKDSKAKSWICDGGRRSLDSARQLLCKAESFRCYFDRLGISSWGKMQYGLTDPCVPLQNYVKWQDWAATYFNDYNDGTAQCKKVDGKGYTEEDGERFIVQAYKSITACLEKAKEVAGEKKLNIYLNSMGKNKLKRLLNDLGGLYNEFVIQRTGAFPVDDISDSKLASVEEDSNLYATLSAATDDALLNNFIPEDLRDFFDDGDDDDTEDTEFTEELLVSVQSIGAVQRVDLVNGLTGEDVGELYRPYMFTNMETLEPFSAWVKAEDNSDNLKLLEYGEKAANIKAKFRFFRDHVYGSDYEGELVEVTEWPDFDKCPRAYRVFGLVDKIDDERLTLYIQTLNLDGTTATIRDTFAYDTTIAAELKEQVSEGATVNLLLVDNKDGKGRCITAIDIIHDKVFGDAGESSDDFYSGITYKAIDKAAIYNVHSNALTVITGQLDATDNQIGDQHSYAYYNEGGNEDTEYEDLYVMEYNEETGKWEEKLDEEGNPIKYGEVAKNSGFTLVSDVIYGQGIMCDIPMQSLPSDGDTEDSYTLSALVYQDSTIQDTDNREYKVHYTKGNPSEDADEPQFESVEQFCDPLYVSYLAMGMSGNHKEICGSELHCTSIGNGRHSLICDDYIVHGEEACTDEDGMPCLGSGKPCAKCGAEAVNGLNRLEGDNAYGTMREIGAAAFADGSCEKVIVATFDGYWDALAASGLAGIYGCPILLTGTNSLADETRAEIERLGAKNAMIVGGKAVVSSDVAEELAGMGVRVSRAWGENAIGTSVAIYEEGKGSWGDTCLIATVNGYYDAVSASSYSYAKMAPMFLASEDATISDEVIAAIKDGGFTRAVVLGGIACVTDEAADALAESTGVKVERCAGENCFGTSVSFATFCLDEGMTLDGACYATGLGGYWDALTGGPLAGRTNAPMLLVDDGYENAVAFSSKHAEGVKHAFVLGGENAVSEAMYDKIAAALGLEG